MKQRLVRIWRCDYGVWVYPKVCYYIGFGKQGYMRRYQLPYRLGKWLHEHEILA